MKGNSFFYELSRLNKYLSKFCNETPRACSVLGCAYLDNLLNEILKARLVEDKHLFKDYIDRLTFDRRIGLCYLVGIIDRDTKKDLKTINKIRGEFAHNIDLDNFNQKSGRLDIPVELDTLHHIQKEKKGGGSFANPQEKYIITVAFYMGVLDALLRACTRINRENIIAQFKKQFYRPFL